MNPWAFFHLVLEWGVYATYVNVLEIMAKSGKMKASLQRAGVGAVGVPKRTPSHPKKSHVVVVNCNGNPKTIRFGQQGVSGAGKHPSTAKQKARKKSFKARHASNIAKGKCSAAYWANKVKW